MLFSFHICDYATGDVINVHMAPDEETEKPIRISVRDDGYESHLSIVDAKRLVEMLSAMIASWEVRPPKPEKDVEP